MVDMFLKPKVVFKTENIASVATVDVSSNYFY